MKVCVFGAGAVGCYLAARLSGVADLRLSIIARGNQLAAIRDRGIILRADKAEMIARPYASTDDATALSRQDLVIVTIRTPSLPAAAASIARLLHRDTAVLFVSNGIPWWWNYGHAAASLASLNCVDADGVLWNTVCPQRALGASIVSSNTIIAPGIVMHRGGNRWMLGEPDGSDSLRLQTVISLFQRAGLNAGRAPDLRREIWLKLFKNIAYYSMCGLTRLGLGDIKADSKLADLGRVLVTEAASVAATMGWSFDDEPYLAGLFSNAGGKPAMLQDIEVQRPTEVEAVFGQVQEFARQAAVPTPVLDVILVLLRGLEQSICMRAAAPSGSG